MILAGRGISVKHGLLSDCTGYVLVLALLFLACSCAWGACHKIAQSWTCWSGGYVDGQWVCIKPTDRSKQIYDNCTSECTYRGYGCGERRCDYYYCDTQVEEDSLKCALDPQAEGCVEEDVPPSCQADYQKCVSMDGVWKKIASTLNECSSQCDLCGSKGQTAVANAFVSICCKKNKAPPDSVLQCYTPVQSGPGMSESVFADRTNSYDCGALTTADGEPINENQALYKRFCLDGDRYEEQTDSNDAGSSSGGGLGSSSSAEETHASFATEIEGLEGLYGVLDTIRDTLTKRLTPATEEIRDCLYNFKLCTALEPLQIDWTGMPRDTSMLQIDTAILKHIKPMMDSSVKLDSAQLKVLKQLDSLYKRGLVNDSQMRIIVNDINGNVDGVETAVKGVKHGIDSLIDSMTTHLEKVGQGLGAIGDSIGELRGMLQGYLDGVAPSDTDGDAYFSGYINGEDTLGSGWLGNSSGAGVWGNAILGAEHDSNFGMLDTTGLIVDTTGLDSAMKVPDLDSLQAVLDSSVEADRNSLEDTLEAAFDTLKDEIMLVDFDSLIIEPLGMRVPNTNTCPEYCFTFGVSNEGGSSQMNWLAGVGTVTFPLCDNLPGMRFNVFVLLRLIARLLVAITCIYIGIWYIAGKK